MSKKGPFLAGRLDVFFPGFPYMLIYVRFNSRGISHEICVLFAFDARGLTAFVRNVYSSLLCVLSTSLPLEYQ